MSRERYAWRKLSSAKWEEEWPERLSEFAERLAITTIAGKPTIRVEVFDISRKDAERLTKEFGGTSAKHTHDSSAGQSERTKPINVRGRLSIISDESQRALARESAPVLLIPAGMAFGTGEHATTLNCLR